MASYRTPHSSTTSEYHEIDVTMEEKEAQQEGYRRLEFKIKNTGEGYIIQNRMVCYPGNGEHYYLYGGSQEDFFGANLITMPGREYTFTWNTQIESTFEDASYRVSAYIDVDHNLTYEGSKNLSKDEDGYYVIDASIRGMKDSYDYGYDFLAVLEYDGQEYCIACSEVKEGGKPRFYLSKQGFDLQKAKVKEIIGFEYEEYRPNYAGYALGGALYMAIIGGSIFLGILIFIVLPAILIPTIIRKKRQKNPKD